MTATALPSRPYQMLPPLDADQRFILRQSIEKCGVLEPIVVDEDGEILDGHHRAKIAEELGIDCPRRVVSDLDAPEKWMFAVTVNVARRHLDSSSRSGLVAQMRIRGMSIRQIAEATGFSKTTVARDVDQLSHSGQLEQPERVTGADGKSRPASRPAPETPGPAGAAVTPPADPGAATAPVELAPHRYVSGPGRRCSAPGCGRGPSAALHRTANWLPAQTPAPAERSHTTSSAVTQEPGPTPEPGGVDLSAAQLPGSGPTPVHAPPDRALLDLLSAPTDPSLSDATYVVRRDNPSERGLVVGFPDDLAWALIAWGEASKLTPQFAATEAVREDVADLVRWAAPAGSGTAPASAADAPTPQEPDPAAPPSKPASSPSAEQREALPDAVLSALAGADPEVGLTPTEIWTRLPMQSVRSVWVEPVLHELAEAGLVLPAGHGPAGSRWVATPEPTAAPSTAPASSGSPAAGDDLRDLVLVALPIGEDDAVSLGELADKLPDGCWSYAEIRKVLYALEDAGRAACTQGPAVLVWWATGLGEQYKTDPAERIAAVAEAAPEFVRPVEPGQDAEWRARFSTSISAAAALIETLDERYPSADIAAHATAEERAAVHALRAAVEAFAARVDAAVAP
jgi:hypothetical protein